MPKMKQPNQTKKKKNIETDFRYYKNSTIIRDRPYICNYS